MVGEVKKAEDDGMLVPLRRGDRVGTSARVKAFGREPFNAAVEKMEGCTSIAVTSRRGLWLSHIWETPSMNKQAEDGEDRFLGRDVLTGVSTTANPVVMSTIDISRSLQETTPGSSQD